MLYLQISYPDDASINLTRETLCYLKDAVACPRCYALLPEHGGASIDLHTEWLGYPDYLAVMVPIECPLLVFQEPLAAWLAMRMPGHELGILHCANEAQAVYRTLAVDPRLWCASRAHDESVFRLCESCGRQLGGPPFGEDEWLSATDVGGRDIVANASGSRLILSGSLVETMPAELRSSLIFDAIVVR